ncbi:hypothetical protein EDD86DRAFT_206506 [Gorgonomyces haynaldii]|nr:hypothetical protein EDD86DRAFT_206506 [Gorgonomyces haynaldii]
MDRIALSHLILTDCDQMTWTTLDGTKIQQMGHYLLANDRSCKILQTTVYEEKGHEIQMLMVDKLLFPHDWDILPKLSDLLKINRGESCIVKMSQRVEIFNDVALGINIQEMREDVQHLIKDCHIILETLDEQELKAVLEDHFLSWDLLYQILEIYVMEHTYDLIFYKIGIENRVRDASIANVGRLNVCISQLGVGHKWGPNLYLSKVFFEEMAARRTPLEKLQSLVDVCRKLSVAQHGFEQDASPTLLTSDTLIPLLIKLVIDTGFVNICSNLQYMQQFIFEKNISIGEEGYCLSTLDAVIQYILNNIDDLESKSLVLDRFLDLIKQSNTRELELMMSKMDCEYLTDNDGNNGLLLAVKDGNVSLVKFFLDNQWSINIRNYKGRTGLFLAVQSQDILMCKLLLERGASCVVKDLLGQTPVHVAFSGDSQILKLLKPFETPDYNGWSPLHYCQSKAQVEILVENGLDLHQASHAILHHAENRNREIVKLLIDYGVQQKLDLCVMDDTERNFIHLACKEHDLEVIEYVCELLPSHTILKDLLHMKSATLDTSLHYAAKGGSKKIIWDLMQSGLDPFARNMDGQTPSEVAQYQTVSQYIDDLALYLSFPPGQAAKVYGAHVDLDAREIEFTIKSAIVQKLDSFEQDPETTNVKRRLSEFGLLRRQLVLECPEACLPDMKDLFGNTQWIIDNVTGSNGPRLLQRITKRLDYFLTYLLNHPVFKNHELTHEFLHVQEMEQDMIEMRTLVKLEYLNEQARLQYPPYVQDLSTKTEKWEDYDLSLSVLSTHLRQAGLSFRKLGRLNKEMAHELYQMQAIYSNPLSGFTRKPTFMHKSLKSIALSLSHAVLGLRLESLPDACCWTALFGASG